MRAVSSVRFDHAWFVPRWTTTSPGKEPRLVLVDDEPDLARDHDAVVDRLGAVHQRMRAIRPVGVRPSDLGECRRGLLRRDRVLDAVRRNVDDADPRAAGGRRELQGADRGVGTVVDGRGNRLRRPDLVEDRPGNRREVDDGRWSPIRGDDRPAVPVVARDDAPDRVDRGAGHWTIILESRFGFVTRSPYPVLESSELYTVERIDEHA